MIFYYEGTILDPNDLVRTALTKVKGNFRGYKYPNNYILDKTLNMEKEQRNSYYTQLNYLRLNSFVLCKAKKIFPHIFKSCKAIKKLFLFSGLIVL